MWKSIETKPDIENALVIINIQGHAQIDVLKWKNNAFYMYDEETGYHSSKYPLEKYITSWCYFPMGEKDKLGFDSIKNEQVLEQWTS